MTRHVCAIVVCLAACAGPRAGGDAGAEDAGRVDPLDGGSIDAGECATDPIEGEPCAPVGARCARGCETFACTHAPDGATWVRTSTCDAGAPIGCTALTEDRATLVHDANAAAGTLSIVWDGDRYALLWIALTSEEPVIYSLWFALADREGDVIEGS